jgi:protein-tyrosine-phosphatase
MKILFVCDHNVLRSQLASALFNKLACKHYSVSAGIIASNAGKRPGDVDSNVPAIMSSLGLNTVGNKVKKLTRQMVNSADIIIVMADSEWPDYLKSSGKGRTWGITDEQPYSKTVEEIKERVDALIQELG